MCLSMFKPGYYQPAGPMIKETGSEADRTLARYHPPHYHAPHPPVLQQYGGPYYPADLCYGRYYRPPGPPYHMPPQPDAQMVGVGNESYPPQYYGSPPCYQHSPQRIPYVEYRGCPCPLNACPKNVLIGPATGKAPTGAGPDVPSALAPPGGAFRPKARACVLDVVTDTHGSGKDPPLEQEPPAAADAPHPCPLPAIGGASPKREIYDVRDKIRLVGDIPGPAEALGPPSPARGSAGACAPQPPPVAPRRARLGKEAARKSLADTGQLISPTTTPQRPPQAHSSETDDDVLAISPPACAPIDLSSSDERTTPLVDVKKENEGPTCATPRKPETQALREQNTSSIQETPTESTEPKAAKRRYSRPKLEIDMKDTQLEESLKTNGIGEHVKLQKRRKVSGDLTTVARVETVTKETKKKVPQSRRTPRTPNSEKRTVKRKIDNNSGSPKSKKLLLESPKKSLEIAKDDDSRVKELSGSEDLDLKSKTKSAILLDNLLRKNSVDRADVLSDKKLNPVELFLSPNECVSPNGTKKTLNINNNIVENSSSASRVRTNTTAAVSQLLHNKLSKVDSKITHNLKSVLKPTDKLKQETPMLFSGKCKAKSDNTNLSAESSELKAIDVGKVKCDDVKDRLSVSNKSSATEDGSKSAKVTKVVKPKAGNKNEMQTKLAEESHITLNKTTETLDINATDPLNVVNQDKSVDVSKADINKRSKVTSIKNGQMRNKSIERVAKLLSKKPVTAEDNKDLTGEKPNEKQEESVVSAVVDASTDKTPKAKSIETVAKMLSKPAEITTDEKEKRLSTEVQSEKIAEKILPKRCRLSNGELKEEKKKKVEKVVKLLVSKKPAIKTDEAMEVVEDACASPVPSVGRRAKRRRSGGGRRARRLLAPLPPPATEPRAPPRWSNGWNWDGDHYVSKVYLNNDSRLDRTARCWQRMNHASGDSVSRGDCVLLKASAGKQQQPFVARVASLWENPEDGEMMVSLVWYYRPEHTERGREPADAPDEVFASRHRDANSVACIEDKCYVLTFNEYCRYRKRLRAAEEGVTITPTIVPPLPPSEVTPAVAPNDTKLPPGVSSELVLFCRKIYDFRSKKIQVPNK
ncbi:BAH domain-containing protein [Phthorimaea operculella]|nr:BAH domain-containing protein [Phthorimaea operculella]